MSLFHLSRLYNYFILCCTFLTNFLSAFDIVLNYILVCLCLFLAWIGLAYGVKSLLLEYNAC